MLRVMVWEHDVREKLESSLDVVDQIPVEDLYQPKLSITDPYKYIADVLHGGKLGKNFKYRKQFIQPSTVVVKEGYINYRKGLLFNVPGTRGWYWGDTYNKAHKHTIYLLFRPYNQSFPYDWPDVSISASLSVDAEFAEQSLYGVADISNFVGHPDGYRVAFHIRNTIKADFVKLFDLAKSFLQEQFNAVKRTACDGAEVIHISNTGRVVRGWQIGHGLYNIPTLQAGWVVVKKPGFETVSVPARFNRMVTVSLYPRIYVRLNMLINTVNDVQLAIHATGDGQHLGHFFRFSSYVYLSVGFVWGSGGSDLKIPFYKHPVLLLTTKGVYSEVWMHTVSLSHFFPFSLSSERTITHSYDMQLSSEVNEDNFAIGRLNLQVNAQIKAVEISSYPRDFPPPRFIEYL